MKILADRAIPFLDPCFADLGEIIAVDGREIESGRVRDTDVLLVRTVTRVDEPLLRGSRVRFVATPASGFDHVDVAYLAAAGIGFAHAPGCNARAVAEYAIAGLFALPRGIRRIPTGIRAGIVGLGHAGSALASLLDALDIPHLDCDPPLAEAGCTGDWHELADLRDADLVSLHVPFTATGPHPTRGLIGEEFLSAMPAGAMLVNMARGGIVEEQALRRRLERRDGTRCIVDTWENEPDIDVELLRNVDLGTPHVAGYSLDARLRASVAVARSLRQYLGLERGFYPPVLPAPPDPEISIGKDTGDVDAVRQAVLAACDIRGDAARLLRLAELETAARPAFFADLRNNYAVRREFTSYTVRLPGPAERLERMLRGLGFGVARAG